MVDIIPPFSKFELSPTLAMNELVQQRRAQGLDVMQMGFGQSPFPVPDRMRKALGQHAHEKSYLPCAGLPELQNTILQYFQKLIGIDPRAYDVIIAPGSKLSLYAYQLAVPGDLLMPVPCWVSYEPQARMLQQKTIPVPSSLSDEGYVIRPEELRTAIEQARAQGLKPTKILLNYPNNPTGLTIPEGNLKDIASICVGEDIMIISDEIYGQINFSGRYQSIAEFAPAHTVVSTGMSKHLSLGGWRLGFGVTPKAIAGLHKTLCNIASETWSCVASPVQYAAIEAYCGYDDIEAHIRECTIIHGFVCRYIAHKLRGAGYTLAMPQGAFYLYPDFYAFKEGLRERGVHTSMELSAYMLETYGIACLPGEACCVPDSHLTLRLSGCDYDGEAVLNAYRSGSQLNEAFVQLQMPQIAKAVRQFERCAQDLLPQK